MTKHRRFVKSEKAKVKLNLKGARLPKGLNVTKTEFKVKKIVLREQLADIYNPDGSVIRKQNVRELLSKLQHHNTTVRNEGLRYLKEQLATYPEEACKHFGPIVLGLAQLSLDTERDVRKEGNRALAILLSTSQPDAVAPFFDTLSSYLRCAMTHIQLPVQEDSLFVLDTLLLYVPSLVASNSDRIFQSFLDMISKLRSDAKPERTLSVNLGSNQTSIRWRSNVLQRLRGLLGTMVDMKRAAAEAVRAVHSQQPDANSGLAQEQSRYGFNAGEAAAMAALLKSRQNVFVAGSEPMHFSVLRRNLNRNCPLPELFRKTAPVASLAGQSDSISFNDEGVRLKHYATLLMPLMLETWMEVRPANFTQDYNADLLLSNEAAHSLKTILQIIEHLQQLIEDWDEQENNADLSTWFSQTYAEEFVSKIMTQFPYGQAEGYKGMKRKANGTITDADVQASGGPKCHTQNLAIARLFGKMNRELGDDRSMALRVVRYLIKITPLLHGAPLEDCLRLPQTLRVVLLDNGYQWTAKENLPTRKLLAMTIDTYQKQRFAKDIRNKVLLLLCDMVLDAQLCRSYGADMFKDWLVSLPKMLCQAYVSQHVVMTFGSLARQKNRLFMKHLKDVVPDIIGNLSTIQVTGIEDQLEGRKLIANLLYWVDMSDQWQQEYAEQLEKLDADADVRKYVEQLLHLKKQIVF